MIMMNFLDYIYESNNMNVDIAVDGVNDELIKNIIDSLSFIYKKRRDRYIRPQKIVGKIGDDINLRINMYNKDILLIEYKNDELKITINGEIDYHMDNITKEQLVSKIYDRYVKHLENNKFKIIKKSNIL